MTVELTEAMLTALRPPATGRIEVPDRRVPELMLRVTASDQRTWSVRARLPSGLRRRVTLGRYPELGIREARRQARQTLGDMARGIDLTAAKREAVQARSQMASAPCIAERLTEWQEARSRDWSPRYAAEVRRVSERVIIPSLGERILCDTGRADWIQLAATLRSRAPAAAAWVYDVVSSFLNYSEARGWLDVNPLPRRGRNVIAPKVEARARALTDAELARIWQASARLRAKSRTFVRLLILTAARVSEVANIAAGEVHHLAKRWTIPPERAKNRHALTVPLHPLAYTELAAIWPSERVGAGYRLLGAIRGSGLQAPMKIKYRLDQLSGVPDWRLHDLRRTCRTGMARLGIADRAAEASLNHISDRSQLVRVYDRHDYQAEAIAALEVWQAHVAEILRQHDEKSLDLVSA